MSEKIAYRVGPDVVWWDGKRTHVKGHDARKVARQMNGSRVLYDALPSGTPETMCVKPAPTRGKVTNWYQFDSALRYVALSIGETIYRVYRDDPDWPRGDG